MRTLVEVCTSLPSICSAIGAIVGYEIDGPLLAGALAFVGALCGEFIRKYLETRYSIKTSINIGIEVLKNNNIRN